MVEKVKKNRDRNFNTKAIKPVVKKLQWELQYERTFNQLFDILFTASNTKKEIESHSPDLVGFKRIHETLEIIIKNTIRRINEGSWALYVDYCEHLESLESKILAGEKHISSLDALFYFKKHSFDHSGYRECPNKDDFIDMMYRKKERVENEILEKRPDLEKEQCQK